MSDIRYNKWLHNSGTGGVSQDAGGNIGIGTTAPLIPVGAGNTAILNVGVVTCNSIEVTGNVSVGGTLTYQDVTNIDSVGIITARSVIDAQGYINLAQKIIHTGDADTSIEFPSNDTISFETAGSQRLNINSVGQIGIRGTTAAFDTTGDPNNGALQLHYSTNSGQASIGPYSSGGSTHLSFYTNAGGAAATEKLRITSAGKIGIGTNNPNQPVSIASGRVSIDAKNDYYGVWADGDTAGENHISVGRWYNTGGGLKSGYSAYGINNLILENNHPTAAHTLIVQPKGQKVAIGTHVHSNDHLVNVKGDVNVTGNISSNNLPGRNLLINGAMRINQKESATHNSDGYQVADMWWWGKYSTDQLVTTQANVTNDHPDEFDHSYKLSVATAETTLDNNEYGILRTRIEGQNLQHLKTGTSSAKELTLSFWAKTASANSGDTYSVCIVMGDISGNDRIQYRTFAPTSTWQKFTMSFVGQENNQIRNDNDYGLTLHYVLAAGSSKVTSANTTWSLNTSIKGVTGQSNFFDNTSNEFYVTGVQLEVGSKATEYEHKSYGEELALCQRYCFRLGGGDTEVGTTLALAIQSHSTTCKAHIQFPVPVRSKNLNYTISDLTLDDDVDSYAAGRVNSVSSDQSGTTSSTLIFNTDSLGNVRPTRVVADTVGGYIQGECEL